MNVTLQVKGREMTFSEEELTAIVEKHFSNTTKQESEVLPPIEGEWFEVNVQAIDQSLFQKERKSGMQERTRRLILEAFKEVNSKPEKYGEPFKTMIPKQKWSSKNVAEMKQYAEQLGDHMADWVEQCLEWAQRISNGESWEVICNTSDPARNYRLIIWKDGYTRMVGGSRCYDGNLPAVYVFETFICDFIRSLDGVVPLVVLYDK